MEELFDALYVYANENLISRLQRENAAEDRMALRRAEELTARLAAMAPEAESFVEKLKEEWDTVSDSYSRSVFLAGIAIGRRLGQL